MKKTGIWGLSLLVVLFIAFYFILYPKLEIVSGYNAKIMCSCLFVTGLEESTAEDVDLGFGPLWIAGNKVNRETNTARAWAAPSSTTG
jgi:hypothetical protein